MTKHLIILPCHSIWTPGPSLGDSRDEWNLAPFQVEGYDHLCFKDHIVKSLQLLNIDEQATLIISGGQTKKESGPISESLSYYNLATRLADKDILERVNTEEFARDSFENVVFLICRYYELHKYYPERITIVGFEFKRGRFLQKHLKQALLYGNNIEYIGNSPTPKDLNEKERALYFHDLDQQEYKFAVQHFENDWYGIKTPLLDKKINRDPFCRYHGYARSNKQLTEFLTAISDEANKNEEKESNEDVRSLLKDLPWVL